VNISPYGKGRINETFLVRTLSKNGEKDKDRKYILQRLHKILNVEVLKDIDVITNRLDEVGITTPKLVGTKTGELGINSGRDSWRMLTYIPGKTFEKGITKQMAENAAALIGRFHDALVGLDYEFLHKTPNFHDTPAILDRLNNTSFRFQNTDKYEILSPLIDRVLVEYEKSNNSFQKLPDRIIHGDLKINNIRFDQKGRIALALLDLDTLGRDKIIIDIGDAVRSWCSNDEGNAIFDLEIFEKMMSGYLSTAKFITREEKESIPEGIVMMILELSARYITDAFEESYFKLDTESYPNLYEQNKSKAVFQMLFYDDFQKKRRRIDQVIKRYL
ncbi:MAG: phosphotransferase enzyme family protein, partial [Thermodesulfobacteriota bacterium]